MTITNFATSDMVLNDIDNIVFSNPDIEYVLVGDVKKGSVLSGAENHVLRIKFKYKNGLPDKKTLDATLSFKFVKFEPLPTLMRAPIEGSSDTSFLGGPAGVQRQNIESIEFTNTNVVPKDATGFWDVSAKKDGSVIAWYKTDPDSDRCKVTIGGIGGVAANANSSYLFFLCDNLSSINLLHFV